MSAGPLHDVHRVAEYPRFRLRTLFLVVTLFGMLFGVMHAVGPIASAGLLLVLAIIGLHVVGNALGTSRRDRATEENRELGGSPMDAERATMDRSAISAAGHRLQEHTPLGWIIRITTLLGAAAGMALGVVGLSDWTNAAMPGLIVGAMSAGVLGGFFGFLAGSFLEITRRAWWQATCESRCDRVTVSDWRCRNDRGK